MLPFLIQTSKELQDNVNLVSGAKSLFWIVEYSPQELGYNKATTAYTSDLKRYSFLRNECLTNPTSYRERLDHKQYRIWTDTPQEYAW